MKINNEFLHVCDNFVIRKECVKFVRVSNDKMRIIITEMNNTTHIFEFSEENKKSIFAQLL
jgi:hypothetical protein